MVYSFSTYVTDNLNAPTAGFGYSFGSKQVRLFTKIINEWNMHYYDDQICNFCLHQKLYYRMGIVH